MEDKIEMIKIEMIDRPVIIARDLIDPEKVRELAESIRENGLLQPVLLAPRNGRFEMVAGDRRYLAHKLLGLKEIKSIIKEMDDAQIIIVRGIENLQRENLTPSEEGRVYTVMKDQAGLSLREISKRTGKAINTVQRYLNFAKFPEEIRKAVDRKEISLAVLEIIQEVEDQEQFDYFFKMAAANGITPKVARLWVDDYEKTKMGTYNSYVGGIPDPGVDTPPKPIYVTCEVCLGACEIKVVRNIMVCPECRKKVRGV